MSDIRVGVIGAGHMGQYHARNYSEMENVQLAGIADQSPRAIEVANHYEVPLYKDFSEMVEKEKIEAATVAVPTQFHFEITSELLRRGIHTLVEKPIASTVEEATELIEIANEEEVVLTVGHIERYNPLVKEIKKIVNNGEIGNTTSIVTTRIGRLPNVEPPTDVITDLAIHDLDIVRFLLNKPVKLLSAHGSRTFHTSEIDSAEIMVSSNGTSGMSQANWVSPVKIRDIRVTGEGGFLRGNYLTQELEFVRTGLYSGGSSFAEFVERLGNPDYITRELDKGEPLRHELNAFVGAIATGDVADLVPPVEAKEALKLALQAKELALEGMKNG